MNNIASYLRWSLTATLSFRKTLTSVNDHENTKAAHHPKETILKSGKPFMFPSVSEKLELEVCKEVHQLPKQDWGSMRRGLFLTTNASCCSDPPVHIPRSRCITFLFYCSDSWKRTLKWEYSDLVLMQLGFSFSVDLVLCL